MKLKLATLGKYTNTYRLMRIKLNVQMNNANNNVNS